MQVCKIEGLGYFSVKDLQEKCKEIEFQIHRPCDDRWLPVKGSELSFAQGSAGAKYRCKDLQNELKLLALLGPSVKETSNLTLEQVQQWAKDNGYTLKKKEPVVQTWKYHQHDLNTNPEALLTAKVGDICKLQTYYFKVESTRNGQIFLTMIDLSGHSIKPKEIGKTRGSYEYVHVRAIDAWKLTAAVFSRSELVRMIKEEDYKIN